MADASSAGVLRALTHADQAAFREHLLRLTPECRLARFSMIADDAFLRQYAQISFVLDTRILGYFDNGVLRASGELRPIDMDASAEIAFAVEASHRRRGIATSLMAEILLAARRRGILRLYINCLPNNRAMQGLARKFAADLTLEDGDMVGTLRPRPAVRPARGEGGLSAVLRSLTRRLLPLPRAAASRPPVL